ncbi:hypothetical protein NYF14_14585 [Sphingobium sp. 10 DY56-G10]|uniref:carboxymuconolactone decarboxylase n=1 Tax=Sphingomonadales TaxID=204457 RepID=UPI0000D7B39D|nr:carboxymuconolactone decarboxylase [Sphingomonas sp. SKA58]EAT10347.1 Carboxymuconolactone decarboxylase [Sphingomonas sp. SKA58]|tara:strand:- start:2173 stop:2451 length:279 start_codon:yes stop_codon:yes gene_type:complete
MSRITIPETATAPEGSQATLAAINGKLDRVPNFFRVLSNSPAVINAHAALNQGFGKALDLKTRERIAWPWPRQTAANIAMQPTASPATLSPS